MDRISYINKLLKLASEYDSERQYKKANEITKLLTKLAQENENNEDLTTGESEPQPVVILSDQEGKTLLQLSDGERIEIPKGLKLKDKFAEKDFLLSYDPNKKQFLYMSEDRKTAFPLDPANKVQEIRGKKYDFWKSTGLRDLFGDWKLPNLNKIIPLEPFARKSVIDLSHTFRPLGDEIKDDVRTTITDPLTKEIQDLGGNVPGGKTPEFSAAEDKLGKSEDRSSVQSIPSSSTSPVPGSETTSSDPTNETPSGPTDGTPDSTQDGAIDQAIKSNGATLKSIKTPKDLLFWSMMVANKIPFSTWSKDLESEYYSKENYNSTLAMINKLTSSNWVKRINPQISSFKEGAISELDQRTNRTANKTMNRQIIASMNQICNELDDMGMHKQSSLITNIMKKIAGRGDRATVKMFNGKPVIHVTDSDGNEHIIRYPKGLPGFNNLQHAINYARKIDPDALVDAEIEERPRRPRRPRRVGPTGKPWTRDDQEMFDFEASREDKF